ncbi:MAG: hypothetical protein JRI23_03280 [Deltaproteobacteria bacterium]|nr:hypothetical protein [Deltaproteobacteria bacterium]MBW2530532.1 hypothetical protein [Deltaproteobacteria bacterium]
MNRQRSVKTAHAELQPSASRLLDEMLERGVADSGPSELPAVVVGTVVAAEPELCVTWPGRSEPTAARSVVPIGARHAGREVTLAFEGGDAARPIVTGLLRGREQAEAAPSIGVEVDGEALVLEGKQQVVLRCGKASITLTRAGKVLVEGAYVSSHATGIHRILGGAVEIN